jgi:hypothetical protein
MGHATPTRQPGAAQITLAGYTHTLPEEVEDARMKLAAYLAKHEGGSEGGGRACRRSLFRSPEASPQ